MHLIESMVTIILPVYNAEKYIAQAIQSVIKQSYNNWELIVVNDGSTDSTPVFLESICNPAIRIIHQQNKGVSAARNVGLKQAKGEYVTFLDADDTFPDRSLEVRVKYLIQHREIEVVGGGIRIMNSTLEVLEDSKNPDYQGLFLPKLLALDENVFAGICYLFRREIIETVRFDEEMTHCEDYLFLIEIASNNDIKYGSVTDYIYNYRVHSESVSLKEEGWRNGYINLIKKTGELSGVSYGMTVGMRFKVFLMLLKWHIKRKKFKKIHQLMNLLILNKK